WRRGRKGNADRPPPAPAVAPPVQQPGAAPRGAQPRLPDAENAGMTTAVPCGRVVADMRVRPPRRRGRGFTIVELMLAVTIVGVLATLAMAGYGHYRAKLDTRIAI